MPPLGRRRHLAVVFLVLFCLLHSRTSAQVPKTCADTRCTIPYSVCQMIDGVPKCRCVLSCLNDKSTNVCGSDGHTYSSRCDLEFVSCTANKEITIKSHKPCKPKPDCTSSLPMDVGILIDSSHSIGITNFHILKNSLKLFIEGSPVGPSEPHRIGIVEFSTHARVITTFSQSQTKPELKRIIDKMEYLDTGTRADRGLEMVADELYTVKGGDRPDARNVLIIITDGNSKQNARPFSLFLNKLKAKKVHTIAVGIGNDVDKDELLILALGKLQHVISVDNFGVLAKALSKIRDSSCSKKKVEKVKDGLCDGQFDMGIIVDSSDSIGIQNFMVLVNDLKAVVDMSDISPQETRMGIIEYSSHARLITSFAHSQSADEIKGLLNKMEYLAEGTRTDKALALANTALFTKEGGDRRNGVNILIVITDGKTNPIHSVPYETVLAPLRAKHVETIAVGIGKNVDHKELLTIANGVEDNVISVEDFSFLASAIQTHRDNGCFHTKKQTGGSSLIDKGPRPTKSPQVKPSLLPSPQPDKRPFLRPTCKGISCSMPYSSCEMVEETPKCRCPVDCKGLKEGKVCGSDGKTYRSLCELQVVSCTANKLIKVVNQGECKPKPDCSSAMPIDIGILIDSSQSIGTKSFEILKENLKEFIDGTPVSPSGPHHIGIIEYSTFPALMTTFREFQTKPELKRIVSKMKYLDEGTRTDRGLKLANTKLFTIAGGMRPKAHQILIVVTDGNTALESVPYHFILLPLKEKRIHMVVVGIGKQVNHKELEIIAMGNKDHVVSLDSFGYLAHALSNIRDKECGHWKLPPTGPWCAKQLDIGVVLDSSDSIGVKNFKIMVKNLKALADMIDIAPNKIRVGIIEFGRHAKMITTFAHSQSRGEIKSLLDKMEYLAEETRTDRGLALADRGLFTKLGGDRPDADNLLLVITDGNASPRAEPYAKVLAPLKAKNVRTIAVGIGHLVDQKELEAIAMGNKEDVISVDDFTFLASALGAYKDTACSYPEFPKLPQVQPTKESLLGVGPRKGKIKPLVLPTGKLPTIKLPTIMCKLIKCPFPYSKCEMIGTKPKCRCPLKCEGLKEGKVCGSDGHTYSSVCELEVVSCTANKLIKVTKQGECPPKVDCTASLPIDIVAVIDSSHSIGEKSFEILKKNMMKFIEEDSVSPAGPHHIGIIQYSTSAKIITTFAQSQYKAVLKRLVKGMKYLAQGTRTDRALQLANELFTKANGHRPKAQKVMIVVTDGRTNLDSAPYPKVLKPLKEKGVFAVVVGIGDLVDEKELEIITMHHKERVINIKHFNQLAKKLDEFKHKTCFGNKKREI